MTISQLDRSARARLRTLSKETAEVVGKHLVMAGRLVDTDPELAYEHAQAAVRRAGRVDVVREAAGLTAYRTGRYAEALRELRTVRRLNGSSEHLPIMADCERGLGRPERALALAASDEARTLDDVGRTELAIVVSGARVDLGELDAALAVLGQVPAGGTRGELGARVAQARAGVLEASGREDEAAAVLAAIDPRFLADALTEDEDDVVVYDLTEDAEDAEDTEGEDTEGEDTEGEDTEGEGTDAEGTEGEETDEVDDADEVGDADEVEDAGDTGDRDAGHDVAGASVGAATTEERSEEAPDGDGNVSAPSDGAGSGREADR